MVISSLLKLKNSIVFKNFFALSILQGTNFLIPLILMPYLNQTIGIDKFGVVTLIQVVMLFLGILTDYGFNLSATREISIHKNEPIKINEIFSTVMCTKLILCAFSFILLLLLLFIFPSLQKDFLAYLLGFLIVLGQTLLPVWFFQGFQQMEFITYLNLISKIIFTSLIFIFVQNPNDYPFVLIFIGLGNVASGLLGILIVLKKFKINFIFSKKICLGIFFELKEGWNLFVGNFSISINNNSNILILSFFVNELTLGYYINAEKIVFAAWQILGIFSQAIYPKICNLATVSMDKIFKFYRLVFIPFIVLVFLGCIILYLYANEIIQIFVKKTESPSVPLLRILSFLPFIVGLNIPAYQILLAYNFKKLTMLVFLGGIIVSLISNFVLSYYLGTSGTCISLLLTQFYITSVLYIFLFFNLKVINKHEMQYLL